MLSGASCSGRQWHLVLAAACLVITLVAVYAGAADGLQQAACEGLLDGAGLACQPCTSQPLGLLDESLGGACCLRPISHLSVDASGCLGLRHHVAVNVVLHGFVGLVVLLWTTRLFGPSLSPGPLVGALTFVLIPLSVDTVAATPGRFELTAAVFAVLAVGLHATGERWGRFGALVALGSGLLCSASALCVPILWLVYDLTFRGPPLRARASSYLAAGGISAGFLAFSFTAGPVAHSLSNLHASLAHVARSHLRSLLWPANLGVFEPWDAAPMKTVTLLAVAAATAVLIIATCRRRNRRLKVALLGWCWYWTSSVAAAAAETSEGAWGHRVAYLPSVGLAILLAALADTVHEGLLRTRRQALLTAAVACVVFAGWSWLGLTAGHRVQRWRSAQALLEAELLADPGSVVAHRGLALLASRRGDHGRATSHLERAEAGASDDWPTRRARCVVALRADDLQRAQTACFEHLKDRRDTPDAWVLVSRLLVKRGRWDEVRRVDLNAPTDAAEGSDKRYFEALSAMSEGDLRTAAERAREALQLDANHEGAVELLELIAERGGNPPD